jgi:hypothetical protein
MAIAVWIGCVVVVLIVVEARKRLYIAHWKTLTQLGDIHRDLTATTVVVQSLDDVDTCAAICARVRPRGGTVYVIEYGTATHDDADGVFYLPNRGRDFVAFVWFVVHFYDTLAGEYVFTSANLKKHRRAERLTRVLNADDEFFCGASFTGHDWMGRPNAMKMHKHPWCQYDMQMETYVTEKGSGDLTPAPVRPLGKWIETYISDDFHRWKHTPMCFQGVFKTSARLLHNRLFR